MIFSGFVQNFSENIRKNFSSQIQIRKNFYVYEDGYFSSIPEGGCHEAFLAPNFSEQLASYKKLRNPKYRHRAFQKVQRELLTPSELRERSFLSWRCWIFKGFSKDFL